MDTNVTTIARWESLRGRYWLEMRREQIEGCAPSYSYRSDNGGGFQGSRDDEPDADAKAIAAFERTSLANHFPSSFRRVQ